jgi:hypothetical protein
MMNVEETPSHAFSFTSVRRAFAIEKEFVGAAHVVSHIDCKKRVNII